MPTPPPLPPAPADWNKTIDDLANEMRRGQRALIGWPESEWALNYERSQLSRGTRFPEKGDIYSARCPYATSLLISWRAPATTIVQYTLPVGCKIAIESDKNDRPIVVYAVPLNYKEIEKNALSRLIRWRINYAGYILAISTRDLNTCFTLEQQREA